MYRYKYMYNRHINHTVKIEKYITIYFYNIYYNNISLMVHKRLFSLTNTSLKTYFKKPTYKIPNSLQNKQIAIMNDCIH